MPLNSTSRPSSTSFMDLILFGKLISPPLPRHKTQSGNLVKHRKAIGGNLAFYDNTQGK